MQAVIVESESAWRYSFCYKGTPCNYYADLITQANKDLQPLDMTSQVSCIPLRQKCSFMQRSKHAIVKIVTLDACMLHVCTCMGTNPASAKWMSGLNKL